MDNKYFTGTGAEEKFKLSSEFCVACLDRLHNLQDAKAPMNKQIFMNELCQPMKKVASSVVSIMSPSLCLFIYSFIINDKSYLCNNCFKQAGIPAERRKTFCS